MMNVTVQLGLAILLLAIGLTKSRWFLKYPAMICGVVLALHPVDEVIHWVIKFLPPFLGV